MSIRVGIIGTGLIGEDHGRKLAGVISGASVRGVTDVRRERAEEVAEALAGARVFDTGHDLIASDEIDAVLVTSTGETHAEYVLACIAAGKPVMCEKPLAPTVPECERILEAEVAHGKRLVIVGLHAPLRPGLPTGQGYPREGGHRGAADPAQHAPEHDGPRVLHQLHDHDRFDDPRGRRDPMAPGRGDHGGPGRSRRSGHRCASPHLQDPQFAVFTTESGILSTVEFFANCQYGYDVRCELVGSLGTASLVNPVLASEVAAGHVSAEIPPDWRARFGAAYTAELQAWVAGVARGESIGPSAWEGYAATKVVEVGVQAVRSGDRMTIDYIDKPALYRSTRG